MDLSYRSSLVSQEPSRVRDDKSTHTHTNTHPPPSQSAEFTHNKCPLESGDNCCVRKIKHVHSRQRLRSYLSPSSAATATDRPRYTLRCGWLWTVVTHGALFLANNTHALSRAHHFCIKSQTVRMWVRTYIWKPVPSPIPLAIPFLIVCRHSLDFETLQDGLLLLLSDVKYVNWVSPARRINKPYTAATTNKPDTCGGITANAPKRTPVEKEIEVCPGQEWAAALGRSVPWDAAEENDWIITYVHRLVHLPLFEQLIIHKLITINPTTQPMYG